MKDKGLLIILSGPSGSGKGTVCRELLERNPDIKVSISATTRKPRDGEQDGVHYFFRTVDEFTRMVANNEFLEHAKVFDNYYGTPRKSVEECLNAGNDCILEIDVQGGLQVMDNADDYVSVFLVPPGMEELERRLRGRGTEDEQTIQRRLGGAEGELGQIAAYDYCVINYAYQDSAKLIEKIIAAEKCRVSRNKDKINNMFGGKVL